MSFIVFRFTLVPWKNRLISKLYFISRQGGALQEFKDILADVDQMDRFQVRTHLNRLLVFEVNRDELQQLRLQLKKVVLEEILKVEAANTMYSDCLKETINLLQVTSKAYSCCLIGCRFEAARHRQYIKHIKTTHPRVTNVTCKFKHFCLRNFLSIEDLILHIKEDHSVLPATAGTSSLNAAVVDVPCRCNLVSCGSRQFSGVTALMTHFNTFHHKDARECMFENCDKKFGQSSTSRHHFRLKHIGKGDMQLKAVHLVNVPNLPPPSVLTGALFGIDAVSDPAEHEDLQEYNQFDIDDIESGEPEDESEEYFLQYYADFLNRLVHHKFIPQSTVQDIAEEYFQNSKKSQEIREKKLRESLSGVPNLTENEANKIIRDVIEDDFFLKAQEKLNTQYKRTKFVQDEMQYVAPVEILLNKSEVDKGQKKDVIHYVPLEAAVKNLLEDKSSLQMFERERNKPPKESGKIADIQDGSLLKSNKFFQENPKALGFLFYSDGVELKNPLGAARGTYKVVQVFYTLVNIPKNQRCQVDKLQLAMIFKEKLLKKYSYEIIYKRMVEDLIKLEGGMLVNIPEPEMIKVGLLLHAADNLEAHLLGGFSGSFSSKSICRFCHIQYEQLDDNIHDFDGDKPHERWTVQEYDTIANSLESQETSAEVEYVIDVGEAEEDDFEDDESEEDEDEDNDVADDEILNKWGMKSVCPLNVLQSFHCVNGFPPDLLHDLLEGVVAEDLLSIIRTLSSKRWFSIEAYNTALKDLGWFSYETSDKPQSVPISRQTGKLKGKAVSQWVHCRNWPLVVKKFIVDKNDPVLALGLKLHELTERVTATEYYQYEIDLLEEVTTEYLEMRKKIRLDFPEFFKRPKPKHHFIRETVKNN